MLQMTTMTQKGQVTIPLPLRKQLGLVSGSRVRFIPHQTDKRSILLSPVDDFLRFKGMIKSKKKYTKQAARKSYIRDVLSRNI